MAAPLRGTDSGDVDALAYLCASAAFIVTIYFWRFWRKWLLDALLYVAAFLICCQLFGYTFYVMQWPWAREAVTEVLQDFGKAITQENERPRYLTLPPPAKSVIPAAPPPPPDDEYDEPMDLSPPRHVTRRQRIPD